MIFRVLCKTERCLPVILNNDGEINLENCKIYDYKDCGQGVKTLVLIGNGTKVKKGLRKLSKKFGNEIFEWFIIG